MTVGRARERLLHPQATIRWRLTLLYGGMFLVCGAALLAVTYGLVSHAVTGDGVVALGPAPTAASPGVSKSFAGGVAIQTAFRR